MDERAADQEREELALFPLGIPLLPGAEFELHVFEPRYRRFVAHLLTLPAERRRFGIVALRAGREVGDDVCEDLGALQAVGCTALLQEAVELPDGRYDITAVATTRFTLHAVAPGLGEPAAAVDEPRWAMGTVSPIGDPLGDGADDLAVPVAKLLARYVAALPGVITANLDLPEPGLPMDSVTVSYAVARAVVLPAVERQTLLEAPDAASRLRLSRRLLRRELALVSGDWPSLPIARADLGAEPLSLN